MGDINKKLTEVVLRSFDRAAGNRSTKSVMDFVNSAAADIIEVAIKDFTHVLSDAWSEQEHMRFVLESHYFDCVDVTPCGCDKCKTITSRRQPWSIRVKKTGARSWATETRQIANLLRLNTAEGKFTWYDTDRRNPGVEVYKQIAKFVIRNWKELRAIMKRR